MITIQNSDGEAISISQEIFRETEPIRFFTELALRGFGWKIDWGLCRNNLSRGEIFRADETVRSGFGLFLGERDNARTLH